MVETTPAWINLGERVTFRGVVWEVVSYDLGRHGDLPERLTLRPLADLKGHPLMEGQVAALARGREQQCPCQICTQLRATRSRGEGGDVDAEGEEEASEEGQQGQEEGSVR